MSSAKAKGTAAETALVRYLREHGHGCAERIPLSGSTDRGDVGVPGFIWQVRNRTSLNIGQSLLDTEAQRIAAGADYAALVVKPVGVGLGSVGAWWSIRQVAHDVLLQRAAGYGDPLPGSASRRVSRVTI